MTENKRDHRKKQKVPGVGWSINTPRAHHIRGHESQNGMKSGNNIAQKVSQITNGNITTPEYYFRRAY